MVKATVDRMGNLERGKHPFKSRVGPGLTNPLYPGEPIASLDCLNDAEKRELARRHQASHEAFYGNSAAGTGSARYRDLNSQILYDPAVSPGVNQPKSFPSEPSGLYLTSSATPHILRKRCADKDCLNHLRCLPGSMYCVGHTCFVCSGWKEDTANVCRACAAQRDSEQFSDNYYQRVFHSAYAPKVEWARQDIADKLSGAVPYPHSAAAEFAAQSPGAYPEGTRGRNVVSHTLLRSPSLPRSVAAELAQTGNSMDAQAILRAKAATLASLPPVDTRTESELVTSRSTTPKTVRYSSDAATQQSAGMYGPKPPKEVQAKLAADELLKWAAESTPHAAPRQRVGSLSGSVPQNACFLGSNPRPPSATSATTFNSGHVAASTLSHSIRPSASLYQSIGQSSSAGQSASLVRQAHSRLGVSNAPSPTTSTPFPDSVSPWVSLANIVSADHIKPQV